MADRPLELPPLGQLWNRVFGSRGERAAARYLKKLGYGVIKRGYRIREGEVDLIAQDGSVIVFVEVKTRREGVPAEAVTLEKQRRLTIAAVHFLKKHRLLEHPSRFDVIAILWPDDRQQPEITHYRSAFEAVGRGQFFR
jgi:putative endonuclease